jgi:hypothetical protein
MKYLIIITLLLSSCFSANIKNSNHYDSKKIIPIQKIDTNSDGNISISEINSFKTKNLNKIDTEKTTPFKVFIILMISVLFISASPYLLNVIQNKNVFKNKQKE